MAKKTIKAQMKQRRDTKANWASTNPVLLDGELGIVSDDPNLYKVGDGTTAWNSLPFRGFDGTLAQELGTSPNAVISQKVVSEKLTELESINNTNYNFVDAIEDLGASITAQNLWAQVGGYTGGLVRVKYFKKLLIKGNATNRSSFAFLKSGFKGQGWPVDYAGDYTELRFIEPNETIVVPVPADAQFLYVYLYSNDINYRPALLQWQDEWTPQFPVWYGPQFIVDHKNKVFRTGAGSRTFTTINGVQAYINEGTEIPFYPIAEGETLSRVLIYDSANHTLVDKAWDKIDKSDILFASFFYPSHLFSNGTQYFQ